MKQLIASILVVGLVAGTATAGPRKVLVLPLDGTADVATRKKLDATVTRLARVVDGQVTSGNTTFADTAAAVGCDPATQSCVDEVRTTLGVEEIVYGTANVERGQIVIVVKRSGKDLAPREVTATIATDDAPEKSESSIFPLFSATGAPVTVAPPVEPAEVEEPRVPWSRDRKLGLVTVIGGGALLVVGFVLWSEKARLQTEIDKHPIATPEDFMRLADLEDRASTRAWAGNFLVLGGLVIAGFGGYLLWRDRKAGSVVVTPQPAEGGATLSVTFIR